jgi:hypothetical protein
MAGTVAHAAQDQASQVSHPGRRGVRHGGNGDSFDAIRVTAGLGAIRVDKRRRIDEWGRKR